MSPHNTPTPGPTAGIMDQHLGRSGLLDALRVPVGHTQASGAARPMLLKGGERSGGETASGFSDGSNPGERSGGVAISDYFGGHKDGKAVAYDHHPTGIRRDNGSGERMCPLSLDDHGTSLACPRYTGGEMARYGDFGEENIYLEYGDDGDDGDDDYGDLFDDAAILREHIDLMHDPCAQPDGYASSGDWGQYDSPQDYTDDELYDDYQPYHEDYEEADYPPPGHNTIRTPHLGSPPPPTVDPLCTLCYDNAADTLLLPCRHLNYCGTCCDRMGIRGEGDPGPKVVSCPLCRQVVLNRITVFRG